MFPVAEQCQQLGAIGFRTGEGTTCTYGGCPPLPPHAVAADALFGSWSAVVDDGGRARGDGVAARPSGLLWALGGVFVVPAARRGKARGVLDQMIQILGHFFREENVIERN